MTPPQSNIEDGLGGRAVAMVGQPNVGKTTLFNTLCGVRARTSNIPGTTFEASVGRCGDLSLTDLPGAWSLTLDSPESELVRRCIAGETAFKPDTLLVVLDASSLSRGLHMAAEVLACGLPCVVALTKVDLAKRRGLEIDPDRLATWLGCTVIPTCGRKGEGRNALIAALSHAAVPVGSPPPAGNDASLDRWVDGVIRESVPDPVTEGGDRIGHRLDLAFTHPVLGVATFFLVMAGLFWTIFEFAGVPMELIEQIFGHVGGWVGSVLPEGDIRELLVDGVVGGLAGTVVFLPQILLLFFLIALLEDTGYLARAAFVMDRVLRRFGLPGQAFVPMLSAHACAIPAIMSARLVPDRRDRLAVVLVAPFLSCSARLPVYVLLIGVLFGDQPVVAGLVFAGCYALGILAALLSSLLVRRTLLRGRSRPMVLELPTYQWPSLKTALLVCWDRSWLFLRKAGTVILAMVIVLWWLSSYPKPPDPSVQGPPETTAVVAAEANPMAFSFAGRIGRAAQPVFDPIGLDWKLTVGVMTSFAAREVFVSTMAVLVAGNEDVDDPNVIDRIETAQRDDGSPMLGRATAASLLVFFVLAMQCLPTLAVTAREAGGWKWAALQFGWMTAVAWGGAWIAYRIAVTAGWS